MKKTLLILLLTLNVYSYEGEIPIFCIKFFDTADKAKETYDKELIDRTWNDFLNCQAFYSENNSTK